MHPPPPPSTRNYSTLLQIIFLPPCKVRSHWHKYSLTVVYTIYMPLASTCKCSILLYLVITRDLKSISQVSTKQSTTFYKCLIPKTGKPYSVVMGWLGYHLSFAILHSAILCLRGTRSSIGQLRNQRSEPDPSNRRWTGPARTSVEPISLLIIFYTQP